MLANNLGKILFPFLYHITRIYIVSLYVCTQWKYDIPKEVLGEYIRVMNFVGSCGKPNLNFDPDSGAIASLSHIIGNEPSKYKIHILVGLNHISVIKMRCFLGRILYYSCELHWPLHSYLYDLVEGGGALFPLQHPPSTFWWPPPTTPTHPSTLDLKNIIVYFNWNLCIEKYCTL